MKRFYPLAFWILPNGKALEFSYKKHIEVICENPELFNFTTPELKLLFNKHDEPFAYEGWAREEIIKSLYKKGFIRTRNYGNEWAVDIWNTNDKIKDYIFALAEYLIKSGDSIYDEFKIKVFQKNISLKLSLNEIINGKLYEIEGKEIPILKAGIEIIKTE